MSRTACLAFAVSIVTLAGCHHHAATLEPAAASGPAAAAVGASQTTYPAFPPDVPQVVASGGPVMGTAQAVAITFVGDGLADDIEKFVSTIGATDYWSAATGEYGVGPLTTVKPIRLTESAPATIADQDIATWLQGKLDGTHPEFPAPGLNTVYAIFYPAGTVIDDGGGQLSCQSFGGYHNSTTMLSDGTPIVYAVLPRCQGMGESLLDTLTLAASSWLAEAATDPQPIDNPAFLTVDDNHSVYTRLTGGGGEIGDMCALVADAAFTPVNDHGFTYVVQRIWSNVAAAGGQDPCVPAPADLPYFNTAPRSTPDAVQMLGFDGGYVSTEGWSIPVGTSRTVVFGLYSTAETDQPISVSAVDLSSFRGNRPPTLQFSFDRTTGFNGQQVSLTITALAASTSRSGVTSFALKTTVGDASHTWLGIVKAQ
jgi:hypothetical protein